ncbi:MAG: hypothetical protein WBP59_02240 [Ilumatobacteraceae bacterium]
MSRSLTLVVAVATFVGAAIVGVGVARVMQGDDATSDVRAPRLFEAGGAPVELPDADSGAEHPLTIADITEPAQRLIPVVEPVAVGFDESISEALLEPLPAATDLPIGLGTSGARPPVFSGAVPVSSVSDAGTPPAPTTPHTATPDTADVSDTVPGDEPDTDGDPSTTPGSPFVLDTLIDFERFGDLFLPLPPLRFDPCAGLSPEPPTPEDCPEGYPAVFGGTLRTPPDPFMFFARGHFFEDPEGTLQTCPASTPPPGEGEVAMTLFTRTPVIEVTARIRPYGTELAWVDVPMPSSTPEQVTWWNEQFDTRDYDTEWATLPICLNVPRDSALAYNIQATGVDSFGQTVESTNGLIGLDDPTQRPPTTGTVTGLSSIATVTGRSVREGMVQFRSRVLADDDDTMDCAGAQTIDEPILTGASPFFPLGLYDPDYVATHTARIPIPPGGRLLVCTTIFPTTNPLRPTATDRLVFAAPTQERPRIVLQGIRRHGDATIERVDILAGLTMPGSDFDECVQTNYSNREPLEPGRAHSVEQTLWECADAPIPVDAAGAVAVPVRLTRVLGGRDNPVEEIAIPIQLQSCLDPSGCGRPREWYEIPIPSGSRTMCGDSFGIGGCDPDADLDGIAVIRVDYPVVAASEIDPTNPARGTVTLIDQVDAATVSGTPQLRVDEFRDVPGPDPLHRVVELELLADRPLHITVELVEELTTACSDASPVEPEGFASEFTVEFPVCAGSSYSTRIHAEDEDGNEYDFEPRRWFSVPSISAHYTADLQFLGGAGVPGYGFLYQVGIEIEGQTPTAYWFDVTGTEGSVRGCYGLTGTRITSRGFWAPTHLRPTELDVRVHVNITTTGETDCSGRPATGLGDIWLEGSFTEDEYLSETVLVLETEPGATLPMRLTLTRDGPWLQRAAS